MNAVSVVVVVKGRTGGCGVVREVNVWRIFACESYPHQLIKVIFRKREREAGMSKMTVRLENWACTVVFNWSVANLIQCPFDFGNSTV